MDGGKGRQPVRGYRSPADPCHATERTSAYPAARFQPVPVAFFQAMAMAVVKSLYREGAGSPRPATILALDPPHGQE